MRPDRQDPRGPKQSGLFFVNQERTAMTTKLIIALGAVLAALPFVVETASALGKWCRAC